MSFTAIDLFSGAGGLSKGFEQAGFVIKAAFEKNANARKTYSHNFPYVAMYEDFIGADYKALKERHGSIDVVIGGPPCQGFSNANRQHNQAISLNNKLVKEYIRAILDLQPKAFVMENVGALKSDIHRFYYEEADKEMREKYSIPFRKDQIHLFPGKIMCEGIREIAESTDRQDQLRWTDSEFMCIRILNRQLKNRKKLLKALQKYKKQLHSWQQELLDIAEVPTAVQSEYNNLVQGIETYFAVDAISEEFLSAISFINHFQQMLQWLKEIRDNKISVSELIANSDQGLAAKVESCAVSDYLSVVLDGDKDGYYLAKDILRAVEFGVPQKRERFILIGIRKDLCREKDVCLPARLITNESEYQTVFDAIADLENVPVSYEKDAAPVSLAPYPFEFDSERKPVGQKLRDSEWLPNHISTETRDVAMERFKALQQGQNFHALDESLKSTYTNAARTQNTIYLRLKYNEPSGTVVNVRKSMWIHPVLNRALSVREAARLQSFPDSFEFIGTKDAQYQQVGNAVPPMLAKAIADHIIKLLTTSKPPEKMESTDNHTPEQRSYNMSQIHSEDTQLEIMVGHYLHGRNLRYRKHVKRLPGKPDLVFEKYKAAVFINGCFWHMHEGCKYARIPSSNTSYWRPKLLRNVERDKVNQQKLQDMGYRVFVVWECELKNDKDVRLEDLYKRITCLVPDVSR